MAAAMVTVFVLTGCGGPGEDRAKTVDPPAPAAATSFPASSFPDDRVDDALLTVADLPTGWSVKPADGSPDADSTDDGDGDEQCAKYARLVELSGELDDHEVTFTSPRGALLNEVLVSMTEAEATAFVADYAEVTTACPKLTGTTDAGRKIEMNLTALSFPKLADETFALRISVRANATTTVTMDLVMVRRGGVIVTIGHTAAGPVDTATTEDMARRALAKVETVLI